MGKFDGILLVSDFDGTLYKGAQPEPMTLTPGNVEAIRYFQSEGGLFTLASGREIGFICRFGRYFRPNAPLLTVNGGLMYDMDTDRLLGCRVFPYGEAHELISEFLSKVWPSRFCQGFQLNGTTRYYNRPDLPEQFRTADPVTVKVVFHIPDEESDRIYERAMERFSDRFQVCRSSIRIIEFMPKEAGKGTGLQMLREYLGDRVKKVVCAGDYENDVPMLRSADLSYAVANAVPAAKAAADRLTVACSQDAIAAIVRDLEREV